MRPFVRLSMVAVGVAVFAVYTAIAVAGFRLLSWILSNPPHPAVVLVAFATVVLGGAYVGYRAGVVQFAASLDATGLSERRAPELHRRLYRLCEGMDLSPPPVLVADFDAPNALSLGGPRQGAIVLDRRLLRMLTIDELEGILAHELAHMESYHTFLNTLALTTVRTIVGVASLLLFPFVIFLYGIDRAIGWMMGAPRRRRLGLASIFQLLVVLGFAVILSFFTLLFLAYSRRQEYSADQRAARVTGKPAALARALLKIKRATDPRRGLHSLLYIHDEPRREPHPLLSTHPRLESRIERLVEQSKTGDGRQSIDRLRS